MKRSLAWNTPSLQPVSQWKIVLQVAGKVNKSSTFRSVAKYVERVTCILHLVSQCSCHHCIANYRKNHLVQQRLKISFSRKVINCAKVPQSVLWGTVLKLHPHMTLRLQDWNQVTLVESGCSRHCPVPVTLHICFRLCSLCGFRAIKLLHWALTVDFSK